MSTNANQPTQPVSIAARRVSALSVAALIVAVVALGLAGFAVFRIVSDPIAQQAYSASQQADAKAAACAATELVRKGISLNTNLQSPGGDADVTGSLAVAANARLSLSGGGSYLLNRLDPATPPELASNVREFASTVLDIGAAAIAGELNTDSDQAARLSHADALNAKITEACT